MQGRRWKCREIGESQCKVRIGLNQDSWVLAEQTSGGQDRDGNVMARHDTQRQGRVGVFQCSRQ